MGAISTHRRNHSLPRLSTPSAGLILHYSPTGLVLNPANGSVTGWKNEVSGTVVSATGSPVYALADADFNGHPSVRMANHIGEFAGDNITGTDGLTIISVHKFSVPTANNDGTMPWYMECGGSLDLWTRDNANTRRGLNAFGGENYGFTVAPGTGGNTEILTTVIPNQNTNNVAFYLNGVNMTPIDGSPVPTRTLTGGLFNGAVPAAQYSFDGKKSEFIVFNRMLLSTELAGVHAHLKTKYRIA